MRIDCTCAGAGEKRVHRQGMLHAIGAWLHCRQADLYKDATGHSSGEATHDLNEAEIRRIVGRMLDCGVLFLPNQMYVSWAVRQTVFAGTCPACRGGSLDFAKAVVICICVCMWADFWCRRSGTSLSRPFK